MTASVSTILSAVDGLAPSGDHRVQNDYVFKCSLDDVFNGVSPSCKSTDMSCKKDFDYDNQANENHYEKLDGVDQIETAVDQGQEPPESPEGFAYKVKEIDGQPIHLENCANC